MKKLGSYKGVIVVLVLAVLVIMYFVHLSNISRQEEDDAAAAGQNSAITMTLRKNLSTDYPQTPKEVIKYFSEITQCYYNEELSDEDVTKLATQMLLLYDDELVAAKSFDEYILDLKSDINFYNLNGYKISSFSPSASTDVEFFSQDGYEWARIWCVYTLKCQKNYKPIQEVFILRKDEKNHWRIFGWREVEEEK